MAECEKLSACPFFNDKMDNMPAISDMLKKKYCLGDKTKCARYMVASALGKEKVPSDLYPNMIDRAKDIIASG